MKKTALTAGAITFLSQGTGLAEEVSKECPKNPNSPYNHVETIQSFGGVTAYYCQYCHIKMGDLNDD